MERIAYLLFFSHKFFSGQISGPPPQKFGNFLFPTQNRPHPGYQVIQFPPPTANFFKILIPAQSFFLGGRTLWDLKNGSQGFPETVHHDSEPWIDKTDDFRFLKKNLEFQIRSNSCWKMQKNGLNQDFLENGSNDFANIGNVNQANDSLPNANGPVFCKNLDLKLWIT